MSPAFGSHDFVLPDPVLARVPGLVPPGSVARLGSLSARAGGADIWETDSGASASARRRAWCGLVEEHFDPVAFDADDWELFRARLEARPAGPASMSLVETSAWKATTGNSHLSRSGQRSQHLVFVLSGEIGLNHEGARAVVGPGELGLIDGERLGRAASHTRARFFSLRVAPDSPEAAMLRSPSAGPKVLFNHNPLTGIVLGLAKRSWSALESLDAEESGRLLARLTQFAARSLTASDLRTDLTAHRALMLHRAKHLVRTRIADCDFSASELADEMGVGRRHLNNLFESVGTTPSDYIRSVRAHVAWDLLSAGDSLVADVARAVGFSDASNFTRAIRATYGVTPREIQRRRHSVAFGVEWNRPGARRRD